MKHEESILQRQCVVWFRAQYPQYAMLLTHIPNEGNGNRVSGAIRKAEGVVRGVPDLMLLMPSVYKGGERNGCACHGLGIEMKTTRGKQSQEQKDFQVMLDAAWYEYKLVRSLDEFCYVVNDYIGRMSQYECRMITAAHTEIEKARRGRELAKFNKMIGKK